MSNTTSSLRRKIETCHELNGVVRTMKAISASSIGEFERSVTALEKYGETIKLGLGTCLRRGGPGAGLQLAADRASGEATGAVVFGSDQGLVGQFNELIGDFTLAALSALPKPTRVWVVGERVHARLLDGGIKPIESFAVPSSVQGIPALVSEVLVQSHPLSGAARVGELHLFYNRPIAGSRHEPTHRRILPLDERWIHELVSVPWPTPAIPEVLGEGTTTLRAYIREFLFISLFRACCESLASENASRLAAMERAEKNIEDLLDRLSDEFHRLRQDRIDEELFDVVAGYEASEE